MKWNKNKINQNKKTKRAAKERERKRERKRKREKAEKIKEEKTKAKSIRIFTKLIACYTLWLGCLVVFNKITATLFTFLSFFAIFAKHFY